MKDEGRKPDWGRDGHALYLGDCLEILPTLAAGSVDCVVTDPPYGITNAHWDHPVDPRRWMLTDACVAFAAEPFATDLITTAPLPFRYDLVWVKNTATNAYNAPRRPLRQHERVLVFGSPSYTPIMRQRTEAEMRRLNADQKQTMSAANPGSVLVFDAVNNRHGDRTEHQSQKPIALMEWLVRSYMQPDGVCCDPFMGSGTTGVACVQTGRRFVGIEIEPKYFDIAVGRMEAALDCVPAAERRQGQLPLFGRTS